MSTDNNMCTVKQRWVDVENPAVVKEYEKMAEDSDEMAEYARSKLDSYVYEDPNCHIRASPLFELSSIKLSIDLDKTKDIGYESEVQLYGHIRFIDDKGNMFTLFKLDYENAKHVIFKGSPIIFEKPQLGTPRFLPKNLMLHIFLKDRIRNIVLFDSREFSSFVDIYYDVVACSALQYTSLSPRLESSLQLDCTIFQCAVLASVSVTVLSVGIYHHQGMNLKLRASINLRNSQVCHTLFDDEPSKLKIGVPKVLCVLAVPVYSPLKIIASFNSDIVGELKFYPRDTHYESGEKIEGQKYQMMVSVTWASALKTLPEKYLQEWHNDPSSSDIDFEIKEADIIKRHEGDIIKRPPHKVHHTDDMMGEIRDRDGYFIHPHLEALDRRRWVVTSRPHEYVELFSVSIHSFDRAVSSSITGRINVYDGLINKHWDYFSGSEKKTGILYPSVTCKSLKGPNFGMEFDLEDANGHQISRGYLDYDDRNVEAWYNRRVCSVIVGKCGYAAAYYTIFECGKQARLKIRLMMPEKNMVIFCVSGTIHARYSNYRYSTKYDKAYFQSTLFEEGKSESVVSGSELPLTKSVVAVPCNGSLIVKANLCVSIDGENVKRLKGKAIFKPQNDNEDCCGELKTISGSTSSSMSHLSVNVVWGFPESVRRCSTSS